MSEGHKMETKKEGQWRWIIEDFWTNDGQYF